MLNLRKALTLIFTLLLITSLMPFNTALAQTTLNDSTLAADTQHEQHRTQEMQSSQGTQHDHHSTQETDSAQETQDGQIGGLQILLLILFILLITAPLVLIWWFLAKKRPH